MKQGFKPSRNSNTLLKVVLISTVNKRNNQLQRGPNIFTYLFLPTLQCLADANTKSLGDATQQTQR